MEDNKELYALLERRTHLWKEIDRLNDHIKRLIDIDIQKLQYEKETIYRSNHRDEEDPELHGRSDSSSSTIGVGTLTIAPGYITGFEEA